MTECYGNSYRTADVWTDVSIRPVAMAVAGRREGVAREADMLWPRRRFRQTTSEQAK
jgi:hypothetical protein